MDGSELRRTGATRLSNLPFDMPDLVDLLETEWRTLTELGESLADHEWHLATDLPGWNVKDLFSHITGTESVLVGVPLPDHIPPPANYVQNPLGQFNEVNVDARRPHSGREILAELADVMPRRLAQLRSFSEQQWEEVTDTFIGRRTQRNFVRVRLFDWWGHEQDIRRATRRLGHLEGPIPANFRDVLISTLGFVVAKKAGAAEATRVRFVITPPNPAEATIEVVGGRGGPVDRVDSPDATITADFEAFTLAGGGRQDPQQLLEQGRIRVEGDTELGLRVVVSLNVTP